MSQFHPICHSFPIPRRLDAPLHSTFRSILHPSMTSVNQAQLAMLSVAVVVIIQFLQLSFITDNAWTVCVLGYLDPMNLISPPVSAPGTGVLNGMGESKRCSLRMA